jgi:enamine deaminase RidA (YjgF/YER057c/UK114 family)
MIERFGSGGPYEDVIGYSRVVRAGDVFVTAGCTAVVDGSLTHIGDAHGQATVAFGVAIAALADAGCPAVNIISSRMYVVDRADMDAVGRAHSETFDAIRPASAMILVAGFVDPRMLVEIELIGSLA